MVTEALWNGELAWRETMSFLAPADHPRAAHPRPSCLRGRRWSGNGTCRPTRGGATRGSRATGTRSTWRRCWRGPSAFRPRSPTACGRSRAAWAPRGGAGGPGRAARRALPEAAVAAGPGRPASRGPADANGDQAFWLVSEDGSAAYLKGRWNPGRPAIEPRPRDRPQVIRGSSQLTQGTVTSGVATASISPGPGRRVP
jgi:hypothetical protein